MLNSFRPLARNRDVLAGALGCAVTAVLTARLRHDWARRRNISFVAEQSRA